MQETWAQLFKRNRIQTTQEINLNTHRDSIKRIATAAIGALTMAGSAQAAFEGRLGNVTDGFVASTSCTASGPAKCTYFYDTNTGLTILNNWNIGQGIWSASAAPGSAQALAEAAGLAASGLTGWLLPSYAPPDGQLPSILIDAGGSFAGLSSTFDGVQEEVYWSSTEHRQHSAPTATFAYVLDTSRGLQGRVDPKGFSNFALAVRPGDLISPVPEPQAYLLMLLGLGVVAGVAKQRRRNA